MSEKIQNNFETGQEHIPSQEEIERVFDKIIGGKEYKTRRKLEDERGIYLWEIVVHGEDGDAEYSYTIAGDYPEGQSLSTAIHVIFFDKSGIPVGGHSVAKFKNGNWEITS